jgi:xylan 1,4-beta-xylosidase
MEDYFYLYGVTAKALKSVDSQLKVGGPATAMSAFVDEFIAYCREHSLPYDFISTHEYPTDPPGPETRTFFINKLKQTRKSAGNVPVYYTEYDDGYNSADSYGAAFVIYQNYMAHGVVDILSWWVFSDIFEEGGMYPDPYNAKWMPVDGLMNVYGIPKPSYRAFQLLHWSGNQLVDTYPNTWNRDDTSVSVFATIGNNTSVFIVNWNVMKVPTDAAHVSVTVHGVPKKQVSAKIYRIDKENTTSFPSWEKMGSPMYLKPQQVKDLNTASELVAVPLTVSQVGDTVSFEVDIMAYSVINVVLE